MCPMSNHLTFTSFADLSRHLGAQSNASRQADVQAARNLRRSAALANRKPNTGPRIAKAVR